MDFENFVLSKDLRKPFYILWDVHFNETISNKIVPAPKDIMYKRISLYGEPDISTVTLSWTTTPWSTR